MSASVEEPSVFAVNISADSESILAASGAPVSDADFKQTAKLIEDILNVVTLKGVSDKDSFELDLCTDDSVLLSLGTKATEEGVIFASSMLGNETLSISNEMLQMMQQQMVASMAQANTASGSMDLKAVMEQLGTMDWNQVSKDATEAFAPLMTAFEEKTGDPETGEFTVDGMNFTVKVPVNLTYAEMTELLLTCSKDLFSRESMQPLVQMLSNGQDLIGDIEKSLEDLKNTPDGQGPELALATYASEDGSTYIAADAIQKAGEDSTAQAENMHIGFGQVAGQTRIQVAFNGLAFDLAAMPAEDGSFSLMANLTGAGLEAKVNIQSLPDGTSDTTVDILAQGLPLRAHITTANESGVANVLADVFVLSMEKPMVSLNIRSGKGGEKASVYEGEDITVTSLDNLMTSEDQAAAELYQVKIATGYLSAITDLIKVLPEDSADLLSKMMQQMMAPSGTN